MALIAGSGAVYALYDARDRNHPPVAEVVKNETGPIVIPMAILAEIDYLLRVRLGSRAVDRFLEGIATGGFSLEPFTSPDLRRCQTLLKTYADLDLGLASLLAQQSKNDPRWAPLEFLIGDWTGEGGGTPGQGSGGFSFLPDQDGKILVRKNHADYPATKDKPAYSHTDLTIVYQDAGETKLRAIYFDDEGHIIHYRVEPSADGSSGQFLSDAAPSQPRYRLTYRKTGDDRVAIRFEIAPPGKPDAFSTYIEATARRSR